MRFINIGVQKAHVAMTDMEVAMTDMENELALKAMKPVPKAAMPGERSHVPWRVLADPIGPLNIPNLHAAYEQVFGTQEDSCDAKDLKRKLSDDKRASTLAPQQTRNRQSRSPGTSSTPGAGSAQQTRHRQSRSPGAGSTPGTGSAQQTHHRQSRSAPSPPSPPPAPGAGRTPVTGSAASAAGVAARPRLR